MDYGNAGKSNENRQKFKLTMMEDKRYQYCNIKTLNLIPSVLAAQKQKKKAAMKRYFIVAIL